MGVVLDTGTVPSKLIVPAIQQLLQKRMGRFPFVGYVRAVKIVQRTEKTRRTSQVAFVESCGTKNETVESVKNR